MSDKDLGGAIPIAALRDLAKRQYHWAVGIDGELAGLVAGDMGYDFAGVFLANLIFEAQVEAHEIGLSTRDWTHDTAINQALGTLIEACATAIEAAQGIEAGGRDPKGLGSREQALIEAARAIEANAQGAGRSKFDSLVATALIDRLCAALTPFDRTEKT